MIKSLSVWILNPPAQHTRYCFLVILSLTFLLFYYKLGAVALLGPDEPRYAQVAQEMYQRADWVTPTLLQHHWFEKPPFLYWLIIIFYHLMGVNEWAARLPNALLATLNLLMIYKMAERAGGTRYGLWSAIVLATSSLYFAFARAASFDMPLTFTFTMAFSCFYFADISTKAATRRNFLLAFYAAIGVSLLAKGLVGIVLIGLSILIYLILTSQLKRLGQFYPLTGLAICLIVASSWYLPAIMRHGWVFIDEFFIQHHFQRYTSNKYHHPGPIYYFLLVIIAGSLPWSLFLIRCIGRIIKQKLIFKLDLQDAKQRLLLLAGIWLFVPLLFFSFSGSKLPGYILPVFPALGLIIAAEVENLLTEFKEQNRWVFATALLLFIVAIALPYFMARDYKIDRHTQLILAIVPMAMAITLTLANYYRKSALIFASLSLTSPLLAITIATLLFPVLENKNSLATLSHKAANLLQRHEKIVFFHYLDYSPLFYTNGRVLEDATGEVVQTYHTDELVKLLHNHTSLLCLIKERNLAQITNDTRMQHTTLAKQRDIILLRVSLSPL